MQSLRSHVSNTYKMEHVSRPSSCQHALFYHLARFHFRKRPWNQQDSSTIWLWHVMFLVESKSRTTINCCLRHHRLEASQPGWNSVTCTYFSFTNQFLAWCSFLFNDVFSFLLFYTRKWSGFQSGLCATLCFCPEWVKTSKCSLGHMEAANQTSWYFFLDSKQLVKHKLRSQLNFAQK